MVLLKNDKSALTEIRFLEVSIQTSVDYKLLKHVVQQCTDMRWKQ